MFEDHDPYCDECADYGCPGHMPCAYCGDGICDECSGCSCPNSPCDGPHRC